ncbi:MAG: hypothetical protein V2I97_13225 [Desulfococcaceae bacterium]|jgi:1,4-alpha-glucan branching enzyme|nr:hypothetical protein [Desulfococcaceae bacterium]
MYYRLILSLLLISITAGCATTGNPHSPTIFWSEEKAKQRQNNLKSTLQDEERAGNTLKQESGQLEYQKNTAQAAYDQQQQRLQALDAELDQISRSIQQYQANTLAKQKEKQKIENEIKTLNSKISALQKDSRLSVQERQRRLNVLNKEVDDLLEIVSSM